MDHSTPARTQPTRWLREPLLHFVILGAVLVLVQRWAAPAPAKRVVIPAATVSRLRSTYLQRTGSLPTRQEENSRLRGLIDDEVLYREALSLGLDRQDLIVRRRLVQKMRFLTEDMDPLPEPSAAELAAYLAAHRDRYAIPDRVALVHVFAASERRGDRARADALGWRRRLIAGELPRGMGDSFLRGRRFPPRSERELAGVFGPDFAAQVMRLPAGTWSEPIRSSYGWHLVRVTRRLPGHMPALEEVHARVRRDWQRERRKTANRAAMARLRARYDIRVERPPPATAPKAPRSVAGSAGGS